MNSENIDKYLKAGKILKSEQIEDLYELFGHEKMSLVTLKRVTTKVKFLESFNGKKSICKIASEMKLSRMTLYRILHSRKNNFK